MFHRNSAKHLLILFLSFYCFVSTASTIDTLVVSSKSMNKEIKNLVILPETYQTTTNSYPVIFMLHGYGEDHTYWINNIPSVKDFADQYQVIIITPDGGEASWYLDSPVDPSYQYETYLNFELLPEVEKQYRTLKSRESRAITGLSMGGHGAFYQALRNPDIWGMAGSMSGGMDITKFTDRWHLKALLGNYEDNPDYWKENAIVGMAELAKDAGLHLIFDTGMDDFFLEVNRALHQRFLELGVPHDYIERPGGHSKDYWENSIQYHFLFFNNHLKR